MNLKEQAIDLREMTRELVKSLSLLDRDRASCCGVTLAQCHAIVEIGRMGKTSPSVLAVLLRLDRSTVTRVVDSLVVRGFVQRETDPGNRRSLVLSLTKKGKEFFESTEETLGAFYLSILEKIPEGERGVFLSGIRVIAEAFAADQCKCFQQGSPDAGHTKGA